MGVSVLIPVYNGEMFIEQTIKSAIGQTEKPAEIIVYDDGSTDGSARIASKYPVRIIKSKENRGIGHARKMLVEAAKEEYLCFISADDVMSPDYVKAMMEEAKRHPDSILYSNYDIMDENGTVISTFEADTYECYADWVMSNIYRAKSDTMSVCYNLFAPARVLKRDNFDGTLRYGEDLEHLLRCMLLRKVMFRHVPKILFRYRVHHRSVTSKRKADTTENNRKIFDKINKAMGRRVL